MDKKEDFAERRARQKEKLRAQRAERQTAATSGKPSSSSRSPRGGSPGNSDDTDDAFVHVDKADAAEAPLPASGPAQAGPSSSNTVADKLFNALPSESGTKSDVSSAPYSKPAQEAESNRAESGRSTAGQQAETQSMAALHLGNDADLLAKSDPEPRQDHVMLPLDHSAARKLQQSMAGARTEDAGQSEHPAGRQAGSDTSEVDARQQQSQVPSQRKVGPAEQRPSPEHGAVQSQAALEEQAGGARQAARAKGSAMPDTHSPSAHGRDSSGWSWGKGWLPTAALQQVAAGALKDVQEMKESLQQAFTAEDSGTETDEEAQPKQASRAAPLQGASGAERQAVLERLQGQDHPLAAGFKILDKRLDSVLGGAAGLAGNLFGKAHSAGRQVAGTVEAGIELFGQSAIRLLDGGVDYSRAPPVTLASCLRQNGGADVAEEVEELCNDNARLCNRLRSGLQGENLATFNADVAHMAAYLDPATLAGAAARDVPRPATAPDIDTLIVEATCRRGAASLSAWQGKKMDGVLLWGLHSSACGELAEAVALCLEALHVFGIEAAGSAAAERGSPVPPDAFRSIADYLQAKVASMVAALSQLADAYLAIADKAAAKALSAFQAQQSSAASPSSPQRGPQAKKPATRTEADVHQPSSSSSLSAGPQQGSEGGSAPAALKQRYPDHVHDPLKVQHELRNAKAAALQCITELYRGLLYIVLYHCHGKRRV
ncbi:hypothetical protein CVIRNUC_011075 [Coccomyxa viridis]|uniref:Uncharacterized protein n=1 Tax=Coccomyxa viridis TaxID=1274662 RepID=A0AAV1IKS0_9CHLO|nr:hypothetical protein CVIRNUC_011075 [Coccomyxa viridis]